MAHLAKLYAIFCFELRWSCNLDSLQILQSPAYRPRAYIWRKVLFGGHYLDGLKFGWDGCLVRTKIKQFSQHHNIFKTTKLIKPNQIKDLLVPLCNLMAPLKAGTHMLHLQMAFHGPLAPQYSD